MVVGAFPIAKLGLLAVKHISRPIGKLIRRTCKTVPVFKDYVVIPPAQLYNWIEVRSKMWMLNMYQPKYVPPLSESMAINMGADILSEFAIFFIGVILIQIEFSRQTRNDKRKNEQIAAKRAELDKKLLELEDRTKCQSVEIVRLKTQISKLEDNIDNGCY